MYNKNQEYWLTCPRCGNKLQLMLHSTKVENLPLHCRKCKLDIIVNIGDEILRAEQPAGTPLREQKPELNSLRQS